MPSGLWAGNACARRASSRVGLAWHASQLISMPWGARGIWRAGCGQETLRLLLVKPSGDSHGLIHDREKLLGGIQRLEVGLREGHRVERAGGRQVALFVPVRRQEEDLLPLRSEER